MSAAVIAVAAADCWLTICYNGEAGSERQGCRSLCSGSLLTIWNEAEMLIETESWGVAACQLQ